MAFEMFRLGKASAAYIALSQYHDDRFTGEAAVRSANEADRIFAAWQEARKQAR